MHPSRLAATLVLALPSALSAQNPGSVLDLSASYHFGSYACEVDSPSGAVLLAMEHGDLTLTASGAFTGSIDVYEWTAAGGATNAETFGGDYRVTPEGYVDLDLDPSNPGTDTLRLFGNADGSVWHHARYDTDPWANSLIVLQKSSGQTTASLSGTYRIYSEYLELNGAALQTRSEYGVATFDGVGGGSFAGTELVAAPGGTTSTNPVNTTFPYSVAGDGAIVIAGMDGAISPNGELFYFTVGGTVNSRVGLVIGVRVGPSYSHPMITGRYSLHGRSHQLGTAPSLPNCVTDWGELQLSASGPAAGLWSASGQTVDSNPQGVFTGTLTGNGATTLAGTGVLTLSDASGDVLELAFSESGDFGVGRVLDNDTNLFFVMRQCSLSGSYGAATAGTGGVAPQLSMQGFPTIGNAGWAWELYDGVGGSAAVLAISDAAAPFPLPALGGLIHVDPTVVLASPLVLLSGAPGQAGAGGGVVPLPIPNNPIFGGTRFWSQALVLDPLAPADFAMSRGFLSTICRF